MIHIDDRVTSSWASLGSDSEALHPGWQPVPGEQRWEAGAVAGHTLGRNSFLIQRSSQMVKLDIGAILDLTLCG